MEETFYRLGSHSPKTVGGPTMMKARKKNCKGKWQDNVVSVEQCYTTAIVKQRNDKT